MFYFSYVETGNKKIQPECRRGINMNYNEFQVYVWSHVTEARGKIDGHNQYSVRACMEIPQGIPTIFMCFENNY
jgi:hypothetical protein